MSRHRNHSELATQAVQIIRAAILSWNCVSPVPHCPNHSADEMGYSKARLDHALKVFRRTRTTSRATRRRERTIRSSRAPAYQSWNFSGAPDDSDEDEYDPVEDRKRLKAPRRKKKDETGKRKLTRNYITFRLTDSKNRSKLEELAHGRNSEGPRKPSSGERTSGGQRDRKETRDDSELGYKLMDIDDDVDEVRGTLYGGLAQTALRSGRVLQKIENQSEDTIRFDDPGLPDEVNTQHGQEAAPRSAPLINRSTIPIGNSFAEPITIDSSDEERSEHGSRRPSTAPQSTQRLLLASSESAIERFTTSYAHPINFKFFPNKNGTSNCHFCTDWTMGVLGHLPTFIEAVRDPDNPTVYQELRDGHRGDGKDPTQMCVKCSLERLLIMRCHSPHDQSNSLANPFNRIHTGNIDAPKYLRHLFCRMNGENHLIAPTYEFQTCSLCPTPASYKCAKYQERDHARRPCQIPKDLSGRARGNAAFSDLPSSSSLPQSRQQLTGPVVISLLDSSSDEDESPLQSSTQAPTTQLARAPQAQALRPPLRGCGLHLCTTCHIFITQQCNGLLPEEGVMRYLERGGGMRKRADVQWLFKGSLLEGSYEQGAGRARRG